MSRPAPDPAVRTATSRPAAPSEVRLLAGWSESGAAAGLTEHRGRYGALPLPRRRGRPADLIEQVTAAGLLGRGGAGFPTGRKIAAVAAARGRPIVLANGCEGEPASHKDAALLDIAPHLVLDGAVLAAYALGASEVLVCVHRGAAAARSIPEAIAVRSDPVEVRLVEVPARYVASEESALVNFLNTGDARPTAIPPRPFERGINGRPTLVDNVETLAHLALINRFGADWFRSVGEPQLPGTLLATLGGALNQPAVYEVPGGTPLGAVIERAGGPSEPVQAALIGGYAGSWLALPDARHIPMAHDALRSSGAALGVALVLALPARACGLTQTAHLLHYLAGESARQCGPCTFGLPGIAADLADLAVGGRNGPAVLHRLRSRIGLLPGRGACAHPDGAARLAAGALRVFAADLDRHVRGRPCAGAADPSFFPIPRQLSVLKGPSS